MSKKSHIDEGTSLEDLAALVCTTLEAHGISVVLSGGAVVSIYSDAEYVSYDLDFIPTGLARKVDTAMQSLGFERTRRHWTHPKSRYWVEFPPGPVAIGEETIRDFAERETSMGTLRLLAPTECVMDRLAWYFHDADTECLEQAIQVAMRHPVDLKRIERWARGERPHGEYRFREFEHRLRESSGA
jgi:hypothetical protein